MIRYNWVVGVVLVIFYGMKVWVIYIIIVYGNCDIGIM